MYFSPWKSPVAIRLALPTVVRVGRGLGLNDKGLSSHPHGLLGHSLCPRGNALKLAMLPQGLQALDRRSRAQDLSYGVWPSVAWSLFPCL